VPEDIHRTLSALAAKQGMSLLEYLNRDTLDDAGRPTLAELTERIRGRPPVELEGSAAEIIREEREARERYLGDRHLVDRPSADH
jgi:hypothetical protein